MSDTRGLEENLKKAREIALSNKNSTFALNIHNLKETARNQMKII